METHRETAVWQTQADPATDAPSTSTDDNAGNTGNTDNPLNTDEYDDKDSSGPEDSGSGTPDSSDADRPVPDSGAADREPGGEGDSSTGNDAAEDSDGDDNGQGTDGAGDPGEGDADGSQFALRFLSKGAASGASVAIDGKNRRESLAAILLRLALSLLSGDTPADTLIPLMDAALANERLLKLQTTLEQERKAAAERLSEASAEAAKRISEARAEGELAGRNALIEEQLLPPPIGAPDLNASPMAQSRRRTASIFDLAGLAR